MWPFRTKEQKLDNLRDTLAGLKARRNDMQRVWDAQDVPKYFAYKVFNLSEKIARLESKIARLNEN